MRFVIVKKQLMAGLNAEKSRSAVFASWLKSNTEFTGLTLKKSLYKRSAV